ncbi:MAG: PEP-CTERM sorting domain-containing protein [Pirellulales bacterium]|nr:PEP-CTERM sorting domain-containing protein [Pirellulales bacterium]
MMRRTLMLGVAVVLVGICVGRAVAYDYEYGYDPQSQTFVEEYDPQMLGAPHWIPGTQTMYVPNVERPYPWWKSVSLVIDYTAPDAPSAPPGMIWVAGPGGTGILAAEWMLELDPEMGQVWIGNFYLPDQPGSETIGFDEPGYKNGTPLENGYTPSFINVGTECIPEPAALVLLAVGGLLVAVRRGRRG